MTPKQIEVDTAPDAREILSHAKLLRFGVALERRIMLKELIKEKEAEVRELDDELSQTLTDADTVKVVHRGYSVGLVTSSRSTLSKDALLENGVPATVIAKSTKVSTYTYVLVTAPKGE